MKKCIPKFAQRSRLQSFYGVTPPLFEFSFLLVRFDKRLFKSELEKDSCLKKFVAYKYIPNFLTQYSLLIVQCCIVLYLPVVMVNLYSNSISFFICYWLSKYNKYKCKCTMGV